MHERKLKAGAKGTSELTNYFKDMEKPNTLKDAERPSTPKAVERMGKVFELGNPSTDCYHWPSKNRFEEVFLNSIDKLGTFLLNKAKEGFITFDVFNDKLQSFPNLVKYEKAIGINFGSDGKWIIFDVNHDIIVDMHNLDWPGYKIVAFNLASDLLETLDPEIKAPRIYKDSVVYPLPKEFEVLPEDGIISKTEHLNKMFDLYGLGELENITVKRTIKNESQTIKQKGLLLGLITIENGICTATGFPQALFPAVTRAMALLVDSCHFGRK